MKVSIQDIVKNDLCTGCGACISEANGALAMKWDTYGFLVPTPTNTRVLENEAVRVCPFNPQPDEEVKDEDKLAGIFLKEAAKFDSRIGRFNNTYVGFSKNHRISSSSGGIATYIFEELLRRRIVDHLFVVKEVNGTYEYQFFDSVESIKAISKTRYIPVTLEGLFAQIDQKEGKIAVSGVACFIKAIRLKQYYQPELKERIPFLIGIICGGWKSKFFTDYLAQRSGISGPYTNQEYRVKDLNSRAIDYSFGAYDQHNQFHRLKIREIGDLWGSGLFKANACDFCDDVATELADISLGDAWIEPYSNDGQGTSVIATRNALADQLIRDGIDNQTLEVEEISVDLFKRSQGASFKHRQMALKYRVKRMKSQGQLIPYKRKRFFQSIPFEFKLVQKQRMRIRRRSLEEWKTSPSARSFDQSIAETKTKLAKLTKQYHRIQRIRRKLRLRTI